MSQERWRAAQRIFDQLVELPESERREQLTRACGDRPQLSAAVVSLLEADGSTAAWIDRPSAAPLRQALDEEMGRLWIGRSLGAYKILEKIGQGGMGQVFLAERKDQAFDKRVAIKIMSAASAGALERFHRERQILADLEHPRIARLLDGGTTPDGLPYVVMELVRGVPLNDYCAAHDLGLRQRLGLFLAVCDAVQYAHRNLVVHRDLKPSNILVDSGGELKLLDFGIAKLLDAPDTPAAQTAVAERILTPEYASPEQILGTAVTTASDVYSLGVLLYETLVGHLPFDRRERELDPASVARAPSTVTGRLSAARELRGDVDNIVLKALRAEPSERYLSVERFAADVENYLAGFPVAARAPSVAYRCSKFVRRHALAVSLAAMATLLLLAFSWVTLSQSRRIEAERDVARLALEFVVDAFKGADPEENLGRELTAQDILERGAARLESEPGVSDAVQTVLAQTLGTVQLGLGNGQEARDWLQRAVVVGERLYGRDDPRLGPSLVALAEAQLLTVEYERAETAALRAVDAFADDPARRIGALHVVAEAAAGLGRVEDSAALHEQALSFARAELEPSDRQLFSSVYAAARRRRTVGDAAGARQLVVEGFALQHRFRAGDRPETARLLTYSGRLWMEADDLDQARQDLEAGLEMRSRIYDEHHPQIAASLEQLAQLEKRAGKHQLALELTRRSLALYEAVLGAEQPQVIGVRLGLARLLHHELGDPLAAVPIYRRALEDFEQVEGSDSSRNMGYLLNAYGEALNDLERFRQAEEIWRRSRELWSRRGQLELEWGLRSRIGLAKAMQGNGMKVEAVAELEECWDTASVSRGLNDATARRVGETLAGLYREVGRAGAALAIEVALGEASGLDS